MSSEDATIDHISRLDDGASYELMMGRWSVLVGARFLDWIGVAEGARWLDVGCGSGAFTQLLVERCKPAAVHWDVEGGGFPFSVIGEEMRTLGIAPVLPPSVEASTAGGSTALWQAAGLEQVRTCQISVQRSFNSFDDFWISAEPSKSLRP